MRVLDEVAEAIRTARGLSHPVLTTFGLEELFEPPITPEQWGAMQQSLACSLPPLEFVQGHWFLPAGFATIWDLVDLAARVHPEWEVPATRTAAAWREAQIFAGVRFVVAKAGALDLEQVVREARLKADLGLV
jgi:hypothetical protein